MKHPICVRFLLGVFLLASACAEMDERAIVPPQEGFGEAPGHPGTVMESKTATAPSANPPAAPRASASASATASAPRPSELPTSRAPRSPTPTPREGDDDDPVIVEDPTLSATERGVLRAVALCLRKDKPRGGSLALELTLEADGRVRDVTFGPAYTDSLKSCVEPRVKAVRYPPAPEGGLRVIKIPINETTTDEPDPGG